MHPDRKGTPCINVPLESVGTAATGEGWTMDICGGAARGKPSHDADFVVSHPTKYVTGPARSALSVAQHGMALPIRKTTLCAELGRHTSTQILSTKVLASKVSLGHQMFQSSFIQLRSRQNIVKLDCMSLWDRELCLRRCMCAGELQELLMTC